MNKGRFPHLNATVFNEVFSAKAHANRPAATINRVGVGVHNTRRLFVLALYCGLIGWPTAIGAQSHISDVLRSNIHSLLRDNASGQKLAVCYPGDQQNDVPLVMTPAEIPDPIPSLERQAVSYPITVTFPPDSKIRQATGRLLFGNSGQEVEVLVSSPDKPANKRYAEYQSNTICVIATTPLKPQTAYRAIVTAIVDGEKWERTWTFSTANDHSEDSSKGGGRLEMGLDAINECRKMTGSPPVHLDVGASNACRLHAVYLEKNSPKGVITHVNEEADWPASTNEGGRVAPLANCLFDADLALGIHRLIDSYYYRDVVLNPINDKVGLGWASSATDRGYAVIHFVKGAIGKDTPVAVVYPADGQTGVAVMFPDRDTPSPLPKDAACPAGYIVSAHFRKGEEVKQVSANMTDESSNAIEFWLSAPDKPLTSTNDNVVRLIPKSLLRANTKYNVSLHAQVSGNAWHCSWSFATADLLQRNDNMAIDEKILKVVNAHRAAASLRPVTLDPDLSKGCRLHARYLVANAGLGSVKGLNVHHEDSELAGYSAEGNKAAANSVIVKRASDPYRVVDLWMGTFYHRLPFLNPGLKKIGFGYAEMGEGEWTCVLDVEDGED